MSNVLLFHILVILSAYQSLFLRGNNSGDKYRTMPIKDKSELLKEQLLPHVFHSTNHDHKDMSDRKPANDHNLNLLKQKHRALLNGPTIL